MECHNVRQKCGYTNVPQNSHVKVKHPSFRFKCRHCSAEYITYNTKFKHKKTHKTPAFICPFKGCGKGYYYENDLKQHKKVHTRKNLYPCPSWTCNKVYTTKGVLAFHMKVHDQLSFFCGKTFWVKAYLQQHMQGVHWGGGWRAACGEVKKWPKQLHKQKDSCKK